MLLLLWYFKVTRFCVERNDNLADAVRHKLDRPLTVASSLKGGEGRPALKDCLPRPSFVIITRGFSSRGVKVGGRRGMGGGGEGGGGEGGVGGGGHVVSPSLT